MTKLEEIRQVAQNEFTARTLSGSDSLAYIRYLLTLVDAAEGMAKVPLDCDAFCGCKETCKIYEERKKALAVWNAAKEGSAVK